MPSCQNKRSSRAQQYAAALSNRLSNGTRFPVLLEGTKTFGKFPVIELGQDNESYLEHLEGVFGASQMT